MPSWLQTKLDLWNSKDHLLYISLLPSLGMAMIQTDLFSILRDDVKYAITPPKYIPIESYLKDKDSNDYLDYLTYQHIMLAQNSKSYARRFAQRNADESDSEEEGEDFEKDSLESLMTKFKEENDHVGRKARLRKLIITRIKDVDVEESVPYFPLMTKPVYVIEYPVEIVEEPYENEDPEPKPKPKSKKPGKKVKPQITVVKTSNTVKDNAKRTMLERLRKDMNFPFNDKDQCATKETSKAYYLSKTQLLEIINRNKELQTYLPKKYKTLNKKDLCDALFS
jgi:hypothetical protein